MHISPETLLLVNLVLAALETVQGSSFSDNEESHKIIRGLSDLGNGSDQEPINSCYSPRDTKPAPCSSAVTVMQSSPSMPNLLMYGNPGSKIAAPYYREYLNMIPNNVLAGAVSRPSKESGSAVSEAYDSNNLFAYNVPERSFAPTTTEMMALGENSGNDAFRFDHVSNAAFVSYRNSGSNSEAPTSSTGSGHEISGQSSIRTVSPLSSDRDIHHPDPNAAAFSLEAIAELNNAMAQEKHYEPEDGEDQIKVVETASVAKPSYKEVLEMKSSESKTSGKKSLLPAAANNLELELERRTVVSSRLRTSVQNCKEYSKKSGREIAEESKYDPNVKAKKTSHVSSSISQHTIQEVQQQKSSIKPIESTPVKYSAMSTPALSSESSARTMNSRRTMVTPGEVFTALVAAVTIGSGKQAQHAAVGGSEPRSVNPSGTPSDAAQSSKKERKREGDHKGKSSQPISTPSNPQLKQRGLPIPTPNQQHQQQQQQNEQQQRQLPQPKLHTYFQWGNMFRLPKHAAPPPAMNQNRFQFPRNEHTSKGFLKSLESFRKKLQYYRGEKIRDVLFEDFEPILNYVGGRTGEEVDTSDPKRSRKYSLTDSQPIKIFNTPPVRTWIPVRCDAIGFDLKVVSAGVGHSEKSVKAQVSIVYDANREARERAKDPAGRNTAERVTYISKEYYDTEYFLNEYNFFQFAHLPYLPKPLCVEYDPHPKIVMEHIPGERVHDTLYRFGQFLREKHPDDRELREEKMKTTMIKILAKVLVTIKYIHSIGFIHADIKPENIMYDTKTGRVVMIDFDLTVSAPYVFAGRGTGTTMAPELSGLLQGPVHFGIDWWAYGSTAAMIISSGFSGILFDPEKEMPIVERYFNYVPFMYIKGQNKYEMTPIPEFFPPAMRSFLYPFFNPDPSLRVFSEHNAYNWIRSHPLFTVITDWTKYEKLVMGSFFEATPMQIGLTVFSNRPVLLLPISRLHKIISGISNMLYLGTSATTKDGSLANVADSGDEDEDDDSEEDDSDEEDDSEEADSEPNGQENATGKDEEIFEFEE